MKNFLQVFLILICLIPSCIMHAQIAIVANGNVGIGISDPISKLAVNATGDTYSTAYFSNTSLTSGAYSLKAFTSTPTPGYSSGTEYVSFGATLNSGYGTSRGIIGSCFNNTAQSNGRAFGVYGKAGNASSGFNYGVFGILSGSNQGAAIYGTTESYEEYTGGNFAGYFKGQVYVSNFLSVCRKTASYPIDVTGQIRAQNVLVTSDERLKENIASLEDNIVYKLRQLKGVTYQLKQTQKTELAKVGGGDTTIQTNEVSSQELVDNSKRHIGFLAQDVQKVYPDLVYADKEGMLSVDYIAFIPMIIEAIKKQEVLIASQAQEISDLKAALNILGKNVTSENLSKCVLYQNTPNPFNSQTKIQYYLDENTKSAAIGIYNIKGTVVAYKKLEARTGSGEITIEKSELTPGIYTYIMIVNDFEIDSKKMVLTN